MSQLETQPIIRPFSSETASHRVKDESERVHLEVAPISEMSCVDEGNSMNAGPTTQRVPNPFPRREENMDSNEPTETDPLLRLSRRRRNNKCKVTTIIVTLSCLAIIFGAVLVGGVVCLVIQSHHIRTYVGDQYSCTGVYTLLAQFGNYIVNSCDLSQVSITAADFSKPDQVIIVLTKCDDIINGSAKEGCANYCHIKSSTRITSLLPSNVTQTCTLDVCRSNVDRGCKPDSTVCTLNITKNLLSGGRGTDFCILSMGVSAGDNTCQRTNLTVQFKYHKHNIILGWVFVSVGVGALVFVAIVCVIVILKHHKEPTRPIAETVREDEREHCVSIQ